MDKLLGFVCALLCVLNAEATISIWTAQAFGGVTVMGTTAGTSSIQLSASTALGATLFTLKATSDSTIASYTFDMTDGNPGMHGAIVLSGTSVVVILAKAIYYPTVKQVIFKVVATDTSPAPATGMFTMTVNFGPSTDSAYSFCVADPTASGTLIGKATSSVSTGVWTATGGDHSKFSISADGSITTAAILDTNLKVHYTTTLVLADGSTSTTDWPLHVLVDNSCLCSGVVHVISGVAMIVMTVLASIVV